jgi:Rod binding domain-containing protein
MTSPIALKPLAGAAPADDPKALKDAAAKFEALILEQMLKATHPEVQGPEADARSLADQALAGQLAVGSPFGIATLLKGAK